MSRALIALFALSLAACAPSATASGWREVDVATLKAELGDGSPPVLIDVRTPAEFASGHVAGAKNIPLDELPKRVAEVPEGAEVFVICQSGRRSAAASDLLLGAGRRPVNVAGGTGAWVGAGLPVE